MAGGACVKIKKGQPGQAAPKEKLKLRNESNTVVSRFQAIPAETVEAVRALSPIEQIVSEQVRLRRSGAHLLGRCPFHTDKTPSFSISPAKQVFHCHGCGAGGDVFQFIRLRLQCGFRDSVAHLAERAGIHLNRFEPSPELRNFVAKQQKEESERQSFERFATSWLNLVSRQYWKRAKAATEAEQALRAGGLTPEEHERAWQALEEYRHIEARVEREGLCDLELIRSEWARKDSLANAA
jgi:DNA primase